MRTKIRWVPVAILLVLILTPVVVMAQTGESGEIPSFDDWLAGLSGPLLGTLIAAALSWGAEFSPWYESQIPKVKFLIYLGSCVLISTGAACARAGMGYVEWTFDPLIWQALWGALAQVGAGTAVHKFLPMKRGG